MKIFSYNIWIFYVLYAVLLYFIVFIYFILGIFYIILFIITVHKSNSFFYDVLSF